MHARLVHIFLRAPLRKREMRQHDTPLIAAAFLGRLADVAALLADGADVNEPNSDGWMPLHVACEEGHTDVATMLLAANAEVNPAGQDGTTPLIFACQEGHADLVTNLLAANADVDQPNNDGATPLFTACQEGQAYDSATAARRTSTSRIRRARVPSSCCASVSGSNASRATSRSPSRCGRCS